MTEFEVGRALHEGKDKDYSNAIHIVMTDMFQEMKKNLMSLPLDATNYGIRDAFWKGNMGAIILLEDKIKTYIDLFIDKKHKKFEE